MKIEKPTHEKMTPSPDLDKALEMAIYSGSLSSGVGKGGQFRTSMTIDFEEPGFLSPIVALVRMIGKTVSEDKITVSTVTYPPIFVAEYEGDNVAIAIQIPKRQQRGGVVPSSVYVVDLYFLAKLRGIKINLKE